jgi:hypothetical protein
MNTRKGKNYKKNKRNNTLKKGKKSKQKIKSSLPKKYVSPPEAAQRALMKTGSIAKARESFRRQALVSVQKVFGTI